MKINIPIKKLILESSQAEKIIINNFMQKNYSYFRTELPGKNFDPRFKPELSPKEMLELGIFGGKYWNDVAKTNEYPKDWWRNAKLCGQSNHADFSLNYYGVKASISLKDWRDKGWIHEDDPRGWVEWYFRYWMGRRHPDDERQIKRWLHAKRFIHRLKTYEDRKDSHWSPVVRQGLLHWAYDARKIPLHKKYKG